MRQQERVERPGYYDDGVELGRPKTFDEYSFFERLFLPGNDGLTPLGGGWGYQALRGFCFGTVAAVAVGSIAYYFSNRSIQSITVQSAAIEQKSLDERKEEALLSAQYTESILKTLADKSYYLKDEKTGRIILNSTVAQSIKTDLDLLSQSWTGYTANRDIRVVNALVNEGVTEKQLEQAYNGLKVRQEKRITWLKIQPIDGAVSDLVVNLPKAPNLEDLPKVNQLTTLN